MREKKGREVQYIGASLAFLCTDGLILHLVPRINKHDSPPLILSPPTSMKDLIEKLEKLKVFINMRSTLVWTSKFYTLDLFLLRDHPMTRQDLHLTRKLNARAALTLDWWVQARLQGQSRAYLHA
jgi:hypothetical protein